MRSCRAKTIAFMLRVVRMRKPVRQFRGIVRMGLIWSVVWAPIGALLGVAWVYWDSQSPFIFIRPFDYLTAARFMGLAWAAWGFITGSLFTALLGTAERGQNVDTIRMRRAVAWGGLAGVTLPLITGGAALVGTATVIQGAGLGAACAAASLRLARSSF